MKLTFFDLDHTLLSGDSDELWCEFLMQRGVLARAAFEPRNRAMQAQYETGSVSAQDFCAFYVSTLPAEVQRSGSRCARTSCATSSRRASRLRHTRSCSST